MTESPQFKHDCEDCIFLGRYESGGYKAYDNYDLYVCPNEPTVLARFSDDGPDYNSGIEFADRNLAIREAVRRALRRVS